MALIEEALSKRSYMSQEEREKVIQDIVNSLAERFPQVVKEMEKLLDELSGKIKEFKLYADKFTAGGD
jgi:chromosome condensin MukBEF complex kleisin-like MukF subunit